MNRLNVYNPLLRLIDINKDKTAKFSSTLFSPASSKQDFFTLKKNNVKKSVNNNASEYTKRNFSKDRKDSQDSFKDSTNEMNISQQVYLNVYMDDEVKTSSTKSYDTHEDRKDGKIQRNKKKNYTQLTQGDKTSKNFDSNEFHSNILKSNKIEQKNTFKSQFLNFDNNQIFQSKQKFNKSDVLLRFKQNIKKKSALSIKLKQFYLFPKPIGQGTYSKVYKAIHKKTGMICAIKVINKEQIIESNLINNLIQQIKIMTLFPHPNIAKFWGFFQENKQFYMIMEYCTDGQLYKIIKKISQQDKNNLIEYKKKLSFVKQICQSLQYLHQNNIMHRDVKPQNVLLTMSSNVKLSDFNWAKVIRNQADELRRTLCGTPLYLAPQQIKQCQYSKSVDLWALGILTYELLTGKIPFIIETIEDLHKIVNQEVSFHQIECFPHAKQFVSILLQKDGSKRLQSEKLSSHLFFEVLDQLDEDIFLYQLQFGKLI